MDSQELGGELEQLAPELEPTFEPLTEEETYELLSGLCSGEAKLFTALALAPNGTHNEARIVDRYRQITGAAWPKSPGAFTGYCRKSLVGIAIVAKEDVETRTGVTDGFYLVPDKLTMTLATIGHAAELSRQSEHSLVQIFGQAQKSPEHDHRAAQTRTRILRALASADRPIRIVELAYQMGIDDARASKAAEVMAELGLITRNVLADRESRTAFLVRSQALKHYEPGPSAQQLFCDVISLLKWHDSVAPGQPVANPDIVKALQQLPAHAGWNEKRLVARVNTVTRRLILELGLLDDARFDVDGKNITVLSLDDKQRRDAERILQLVDGLMGRDPTFVSSGLEKLHKILRDQEAIHTLIDKAERDSIGMKRRRNKAMELGLIERILESSETPLSARRITEALASEGHTLPYAQTKKLLGYLAKSGAIRSGEDRWGNIYERIEDDPA